MTSTDERMRGRIAVVGSIHRDLQLDVPHLPGAGETVLGAEHRLSTGGKGANQAVAAAATGQSVILVGRVGADRDGVAVRSAVASRGVDVGHVIIDPEAPTGVALILVDPAGENQIAVSPGASRRLTPGDVAGAAEAIGVASTLILQLEVPLETVQAAMGYASRDTIVVLNPAPAGRLPRGLLERTDVLVPNVVELSQLTGRNDLNCFRDIRQAARDIPGDSVVVVTLGSDGALLVEKDQAHHIPAEQVDVVDTTGAGDAFCGALASSLACGDRIEDAVRAANAFAAHSTTHAGALPPMPGGASAE